MSFPWKNKPDPIQLRAMKKAYGKPAYALFHAMGAGKTFTTINLAAAYKMKQRIKHLVVVCPTAIKSVWGKEFEKHSPVDFEFHTFQSGGGSALARWDKSRDRGNLAVLSFGIEAMSQGRAFDELTAYMSKHEDEGIMLVVDESSKIKTYKSTRTKKMIKAGKLARYRIILTGTPITQGYEDLFAQFMFLDPGIIGTKSYMLYKNMYCIQGGFEGRKIIGYQNTDILMDRIRDYCDIVTKEEALPGLPEKRYVPPIEVEPTAEQKRAMKQLHDEMMAEMEGDTLTVSTVMDRLTRYQQICGGFYPHNDDENGGYKTRPIAGKNPKLDALLSLAESIVESDEKAIIWARFRPELEMIAAALRAKYGDDVVLEFHGGVSDEDRSKNTEEFEKVGSKARFMVANATVGGMGQTWISATKTIYYSNTFSYEDRMQSEDRNHRRGQHNAVTYYDIVMKVKADEMILKAIARKHDVAEEFKSGVKQVDFGEAA